MLRRVSLTGGGGVGVGDGKSDAPVWQYGVRVHICGRVEGRRV